MKINWIYLFILAFLSSCKSIPNNVEIANQFVEAFYSFDSIRLSSILTKADQSKLGILYYQKWAECGNYKIMKKNDYIEKNDSTILCPITVKDDLIGALNIDFYVTDTFHLHINKGQIRYMQTSSNDPDIYHKAKEWVIKNYPELIEESCKGIWAPCECVKAMIKGYAKFLSAENQK